MKNIILYGMRGTGKSAVGKKLADSLGYNFIDLDNYISNKNNEKLIDFIKKNGWKKFRDEEFYCLKEVLKIKGNNIISLGGGTIIFERNRELINSQKNNKLIYLNTSLENISSRILKQEKSGEKRNSLTGKSVLEELKQIFEERKDVYKNNCDFEVDNNGTIENCVLEIKRKINYGGVCVPVISEKNIFDFFDEVRHDRKIEYIELRLDLFNDLSNLEKIIKSCPKKIICTNRAKFEGGKFEGSYEESLELLNKCLDFGADYIDIELESLERINNVGVIPCVHPDKLIISHHNFSKTPDLDFLKNILEKIKKYNPVVYKIAVTPESKKDVEKIFELNKYFNSTFLSPVREEISERQIGIFKNIFISMGKLGEKTRFFLPKYGNLLSFGIYSRKGSAPGQINYIKLHKKIFEEKEVLFLGGSQISGSFSPFMHNYSSNKLKQEENKFRYKLEKKEKYLEKDAQNFIKKLESDEKYLGANITMPYKIDVYNYLLKKSSFSIKGSPLEEGKGDGLYLDKNAKLVGAVNTLYKKDGKIYGTNTDLEGVKNPILEKLGTGIKNINSVYILGAGGASRAAIAAMIDLKIKNIFVLNRSQKGLDEIENHFKNYLGENQKLITKIYDVEKNNFPELKSKSIIINTLPFGFKKNLPKTPIKFEDLEKIKNNLELYFEAVYDANEGDTPIVKEICSRYSNVKICRGIEMLIGQAKTGFELWSNGGEFKTEEIKNILMKK